MRVSRPGRARPRIWPPPWSRAAGQATAYVTSNLVATVIGGIVTMLLARSMAAGEFGSYAFASAFIPLLAMLFEFGLFLPAGRMAARSDALEGREVFGATLVTYAPVGAAFCLTLYCSSFVVDRWFHVEAGAALRLVSPLALVYPFRFVAEQLSQGLDRLHVYSAARVAGRALFLGVLAVLLAWDARLRLSVTLLLETCATLAGWALLIAWLGPRWRQVARYARILTKEARAYGVQAYLGRILSVGTYNMDVLMVAAFSDASSVGYYTLAAAIASAVGLPSMGMAAALFPRLTRERVIEPRLIGLAALLGSIVTVLVVALAGPLVDVALSSRYQSAVALVPPLALAQLVRGVTGVFNMFLAAHARGRELQNSALVLTVSNVALNVALIPRFGAAGAAWASLVALVANLIAHVVLYRRAVEDSGRAEDAAPEVEVRACPA